MIPGKGLREMYDQKLADTEAELARIYEHQDELRHLLASHLGMDPDESLESLISGVGNVVELYRQVLERFQEIREQHQALRQDYALLVTLVRSQVSKLRVSGSGIDDAIVTLREATKVRDDGQAE